jgi:TfoX/Sxy family transcriptional regulator of competence genes
MGTSLQVAEGILDQLSGAGTLSMRKMFGEYALYLDGKVVALICDDVLFVKPTPGALALLENNPMDPPYPGAKPHLRIEAALDDADLMAQVLHVVARELPAPKPKKAK